MNMESKPVTGIATSDEDISITVKDLPEDINILADIFDTLASKKINIDMISQTAPMKGLVNVSFTIPKEDIEDGTGILLNFVSEDKISKDRDITKFSIVGIGMKSTSGVAARMFRVFKDNGIQVKMITTSEIRITCAIKKEDKLKAIELIAEEFNL